jgi:hypothetical protein
MLGMNPISSDFGLVHPHNYIPIVLDGKMMGSISPEMSHNLVHSLRFIKIR